jgi:hypothetical protein
MPDIPNTIPSNINPTQINSTTSGLSNINPKQVKLDASGLSNKPKNTSSSIDKIKGSMANNNTFKNVDNPQDFLNEQTTASPSTSQTISTVVSILLPLLTNFINAEKAANLLVDKLINDTKKQLKDKGRVEVVDGIITFTPKNPGNYEIFKSNFERKVQTLKNIFNVLKKIFDALTKLVQVLQAALVAAKALVLILKAQLPTNPGLALTIKTWEDRIDTWLIAVSVLLTVLKVLKRLVDAISSKLNKLSFIINNTSQTNTASNTTNELNAIINDTPIILTATPTEEDYKNYTLKIITSPSGFIQAVAYDKFSMMKIAQTALTKTRGVNQLFDEIKQILG